MNKGPILITGGAGYIGSHTVRHLTAEGRKIVVLDNLAYGHPEAILDPAVKFVLGNVGDQELVRSLFQKHNFSAVIHFAAFAYVGESVTDPSEILLEQHCRTNRPASGDAGIFMQAFRIFIHLRHLRHPRNSPYQRGESTESHQSLRPKQTHGREDPSRL